MDKIIDVIPGEDGRNVYAYTGKHAPYKVGLTIGEIIKGLPDPQTARMCLTDIMATLAEYEIIKGARRLAHLPFATEGLLTVSGGRTTLTAHNPETGQHIEVSGKVCVFECSEEESVRHDAAAEEIIKHIKGGVHGET